MTFLSMATSGHTVAKLQCHLAQVRVVVEYFSHILEISSRYPDQRVSLHWIRATQLTLTKS